MPSIAAASVVAAGIFCWLKYKDYAAKHGAECGGYFMIGSVFMGSIVMASCYLADAMEAAEALFFLSSVGGALALAYYKLPDCQGVFAACTSKAVSQEACCSSNLLASGVAPNKDDCSLVAENSLDHSSLVGEESMRPF
jgi:hypothetical protein